MIVISIIPRLPPVIDGVGDYALNLALQLRQNFGIETHFLVCDPRWVGLTEIEGFSISQVFVQSADTLLSLLPNDRSTPVLLHYVGYGYAKRGCPVWLVNGLQRWRTADVNRCLVTMFHELYAFGPPWTSSFWLSPVQKGLAARLAKLSDRVLTNREGYAELLHQLSQRKHVQIPAISVFSSIGEPEQVPPLAERSRRLVVFGRQANRLRIYQESLATLSRTCQLLEIQEIFDIGTPTGLNLSTVDGVSILEMGERSALEIGNILLSSLAGFFDYNPDFLAKSTIFAAYCAHGMLPVSARCRTFPIDGIIGGKHYWIPDGMTENQDLPEQLQAIADNAHAWYHTHTLRIQAEIFSVNLSF